MGKKFKVPVQNCSFKSVFTYFVIFNPHSNLSTYLDFHFPGKEAKTYSRLSQSSGYSNSSSVINLGQVTMPLEPQFSSNRIKWDALSIIPLLVGWDQGTRNLGIFMVAGNNWGTIGTFWKEQALLECQSRKHDSSKYSKEEDPRQERQRNPELQTYQFLRSLN